MPSVPVSGGTGKAQTLELSDDVFGANGTADFDSDDGKRT